MRVLVVDDRKRTRQSLTLLLRTIKTISDIWEAADGLEAVEFAQEFKPDVVLMDARMPEMDGIEATGVIKGILPQVRIIVLSMYPEYRECALNAGADLFLIKGEPPEELIRVLDDMIKDR